MIHAAMVVLVYGAEMATTTQHTQCQVYLNWVQQGVTDESNAECQIAILWLEYNVHVVTRAKSMHFDTVFQYREGQLLHEFWAKAIHPRCVFTKTIGTVQPAAGDGAYKW